MSDLTIFVNEDDPRYMIQKGLISAQKVKIIKSVGVDTDYFSPERVKREVWQDWRHRLSPHGLPIVMMVARAIWHKGIVEFYEAARKLKGKAVFVLVGGTDSGNPSCADRAFLSQKEVVWIGEQEDMLHLTAVSDIYVLPSYREGVPRTLLEAASMGKPLVASDVVGCKEVVEDRVNGFLVPPKDANGLAHAIDLLLQKPSLRKQFGEASRKKAQEEFAIEKIVAQYLPLYGVA